RLSRVNRHSLRDWCYGLYVLSPVYRLDSHRRFSQLREKLDPSVGRSGPHDFAVRAGTARLAGLRVHRIPRPTSVTIANRPSWWARDARKRATDLPDGASEIFRP